MKVKTTLHSTTLNQKVHIQLALSCAAMGSSDSFNVRKSSVLSVSREDRAVASIHNGIVISFQSWPLTGTRIRLGSTVHTRLFIVMTGHRECLPLFAFHSSPTALGKPHGTLCLFGLRHLNFVNVSHLSFIQVSGVYCYCLHPDAICPFKVPGYCIVNIVRCPAILPHGLICTAALSPLYSIFIKWEGSLWLK